MAVCFGQRPSVGPQKLLPRAADAFSHGQNLSELWTRPSATFADLCLHEQAWNAGSVGTVGLENRRVYHMLWASAWRGTDGRLNAAQPALQQCSEHAVLVRWCW